MLRFAFNFVSELWIVVRPYHPVPGAISECC